MSGGVTHRVTTEVALPGVIAQIVESHYGVGGRGSHCDANIMLRCRLWPSKISISAWQGRSDPIATGQMIYMPAGAEGENVASASEHLRSVSLKIAPSWIEGITGGAGGALLGQSWANFDLRNAEIEYAMRRLSAELIAPGACSKVLLEACTASIAADLVRHFGDNSRSEVRDSLNQARISRIEDFVRNYPDGIPSLSAIAADLGIGVGYLRQIYKNETGKTLIKFVDEMRICRARALLCDRSLPLKWISHQLGFCTHSAFSFVFRKATGFTPREYRMRNS